MGWGTTADVEVYLGRTPKGEIGERIAELEGDLGVLRDRLMVLAASSPRRVEEDGGRSWDWGEYCRMEVSEVMEALGDSHRELERLYLVRGAMEEGREVVEG